MSLANPKSCNIYCANIPNKRRFFPNVVRSFCWQMGRVLPCPKFHQPICRRFWSYSPDSWRDDIKSRFAFQNGVSIQTTGLARNQQKMPIRWCQQRLVFSGRIREKEEDPKWDLLTEVYETTVRHSTPLFILILQNEPSLTKKEALAGSPTLPKEEQHNSPY